MTGPSTPTDPLVETLRHTLAEHADPQRAAGQQAYMKSAMPYRGITYPALARLTKPLLADGIADRGRWLLVIGQLWDQARFREERYCALHVAQHRTATEHRLADPAGSMTLYRHLIATGQWWDLVDEVAVILVREQLLTRPDLTAPQLRRWSTDPDLWLRRAAIIAQVGAKAATDRELLADVIAPNLEGTASANAKGHQDFFIRKAIGWVLRDLARTDPDWVRGYVEEHRPQLAGLSVREALKHL